MNEGAKLVKLGANLIIEKKRARGGGREESEEEKGYEVERRDSEDRQLLQTVCVCAREKERERVSGRGREIFKYLYDGSLFRPLINGTEEGRCN